MTAAPRRGRQGARAAPRAARPPRPGGGWYGRPDWRLTAAEATRIAGELEAAGWRAEGVHLAQGVALVEVRDPAVRRHPLVATLRAPGEAEAWRRAHGHGRRGRGPRPPEEGTAVRAFRERTYTVAEGRGEWVIFDHRGRRITGFAFLASAVACVLTLLEGRFDR
jgi:hypothetical protein